MVDERVRDLSPLVCSIYVDIDIKHIKLLCTNQANHIVAASTSTHPKPKTQSKLKKTPTIPTIPTNHLQKDKS